MFSMSNGEPHLNYYRSEEDAFCSLPIKRVNLNDCFKVQMDLIHGNHKNIFALYLPERVYYFSSTSQSVHCVNVTSLSVHYVSVTSLSIHCVSVTSLSVHCVNVTSLSVHYVSVTSLSIHCVSVASLSVHC